MPLILHTDVMHESSGGGSVHQTLVGGGCEATPFLIRLQCAPPGYRTRLHSHPYLEVLMICAGEAEAWTEEDTRVIRLVPGVTLVVPANIKHWFHVLGNEPFNVYGIHASSRRIVHFHD